MLSSRCVRNRSNSAKVKVNAEAARKVETLYMRKEGKRNASPLRGSLEKELKREVWR